MKPKAFAPFTVIVSLLVIGFVILAQPRPSLSPLISPLPTAAQPAVGSPTPQDVVAATRTPFPTLAITPPRLPLPTYTAAPTPTPIVFATPVLSATPSGTVPTQGLMSLWYAAYPASNSNLKLMAVVLDENGNTRGSRFGDGSIDLGLGPRGNRPGEQPMVYDAVPSPDGTHAFLAYDFALSRIVDLRSGAVTTIMGTQGLAFAAWMPDSSRFFLRSYGSEPLASWDNTGQSATEMRFPGNMPTTTATTLTCLAFSANGVDALDALVLDPIAGVRSSRTTQISISDSRTGFRRTLFEQTDARAFNVTWLTIDTAAFLLESPLPDAPSGRFGIPENHIELWQLNVRNGQAKRIAEVGSRVEYAHPIVRLEGGNIGFVKIERVKDGKDDGNALYVYVSATGETQGLARYSDRRITGARASPDGRWVGFIASGATLGEVWVVSVDGASRRVVAGPVATDSPIFWAR